MPDQLPKICGEADLMQLIISVWKAVFMLPTYSGGYATYQDTFVCNFLYFTQILRFYQRLLGLFL